MFETLPASRVRPAGRRVLSAGSVAIAAHGALIAVAIWATASVATPVVPIVIGPPVDFPAPTSRRAPRSPTVPSVSAPWQIPGLPAVALPQTGPNLPVVVFDPRGAVGAAGTDAAGDQGPDIVFQPDFVDQQPELLAGPPLAYPESLRQAGIQGRVRVRAVVDTAGRVEAGSASVVESPNPGFVAPALAYVRRALFRPARVFGRAVRVLVEVPIEFRIAR